MATTTNFGWETPDDTDLVKDGAAAIRTALGGVDTSFVDLKGGTTSQVLAKASNTDLDFTWVAPSKVVQIVQGTTGTTKSTSSSTLSDTNLTATITPTSASNKILVFANQNGVLKESGNTSAVIYLNRGATAISQMVGYGGYTNTTTANNIGSVSTVYLDSPATTSAVTYKTQIASQANIAQVFAQHGGEMSTITLMEVTP